MTERWYIDGGNHILCLRYKWRDNLELIVSLWRHSYYFYDTKQKTVVGSEEFHNWENIYPLDDMLSRAIEWASFNDPLLLGLRRIIRDCDDEQLKLIFEPLYDKLREKLVARHVEN